MVIGNFYSNVRGLRSRLDMFTILTIYLAMDGHTSGMHRYDYHYTSKYESLQTHINFVVQQHGENYIGRD